jgi:hypothetical protein
MSRKIITFKHSGYRVHAQLALTWKNPLWPENIYAFHMILRKNIYYLYINHYDVYSVHRPTFKIHIFGPIVENSPVLMGLTFQMPPHVLTHIIKQIGLLKMLQISAYLHKIQRLISSTCFIQSSESTELLISRNYINGFDIQNYFLSGKSKDFKHYYG